MSTTDLRTRGAELVADLKAGYAVTLIHRSEVVGVIEPHVSDSSHADRLNGLKRFVELNKGLPRLTAEERDAAYREAMEKKHGRHIS